jgi:hypothetical protein
MGIKTPEIAPGFWKFTEVLSTTFQKKAGKLVKNIHVAAMKK